MNKKTIKIKYPKILSLVFIMIITYVVFSDKEIYLSINRLENFQYLGIFLAGMLFSFGFTAPISVGFFVVLNPENIFLATIIAGIGAMISDLLIFKFVKVSFEEEFSNLKKEKINLKLKEISYKIFSKEWRSYLSYVFAGFLIASPFPDEIGLTILAGATKINQKTLSILGFVLNSLGIFLILLFRKSIF